MAKNYFTNILSIFPYNTVSKFLQNNCVHQTTKYALVRFIWLNRVFVDHANTNQRNCLTIDCSSINQNGPGRYRTKAGNPVEQVCYFNKAHNDQFFHIFISKRIKSGNFKNWIYFQIDCLQSKTNKELLVLIKLFKKWLKQ